MKILFFEIFTVFGEIAGGDAKQVCYASEEFKKQGHEVKILNFNIRYSILIRELKFFRKFFAVSRKDAEADVIYASGTPFWAMPTYLLGKKLRCPTLLYVTHFNELRVKFVQIFYLSRIAMREGGVSLFLKSVANNLSYVLRVAPDLMKSGMFFNFSLKKIDKVIASCDYVKRKLQRKTDKDVEVVYPLIEKALENVESSGSADSTTIFYFGAFYSGRGVIDLLYAFMRVRKNFPEWKLVIAGYPRYEDTTEAIVRRMVGKYELSSCVEVWKFRADVLGELKKAAIVCIPFQDGALFQPPLTLLEALRMGKCVISTGCGAVAEFIVDGKSGFLVKPGDIGMLESKISYLIQNPDVIKRTGEEARATIREKCDFNTGIRRIENILQEALSDYSKKR